MTQQDNIAVTIGGQRQAAAINALLSDGAATLGTLTAAEDAHGQAADRAQQIQQVLNAQIAKFGQNITNLVSNVLRSGIADSFVLLLEVVNKLLGGVNTVFSTINAFAEGNPLIGFLQHTTLGMVGLAIAILAVRKALSGLRGALARGGGQGVAEFLAGGLGGGSLRRDCRGFRLRRRGWRDQPFATGSAARRTASTTRPRRGSPAMSAGPSRPSHAPPARSAHEATQKVTRVRAPCTSRPRRMSPWS